MLSYVRTHARTHGTTSTQTHTPSSAAVAITLGPEEHERTSSLLYFYERQTDEKFEPFPSSPGDSVEWKNFT